MGKLWWLKGVESAGSGSSSPLSVDDSGDGLGAVSSTWLQRTVAELKESGLEGKTLSRAIASAIRETRVESTVASSGRGSSSIARPAAPLDGVMASETVPVVASVG